MSSVSKFDPTKPVRTTHGLPARIVDRNRMSVTGRSLLALVEDAGSEMPVVFFQNGKHGVSYNPGGVNQSWGDLENIEVRRWKWAVKFSFRLGEFVTAHWSTEEEVKKMYSSDKFEIIGRILETEKVEN